MRAERVVALGLGRAGRVVALVLGVLLMLPGLAMVTAGGTLVAGSVLGRDSGGYVRADVAHFQSGTAAVTAGALSIIVDAGTPQWLVERLAVDVRLDVARGEGVARFVGIAPTADVDAYLAGVARDEVTAVSGNAPGYRRIMGATVAARPGEQTFWAASAAGPGPLQLDWAATSGRWTVVLMNVDATPGVGADVTTGVRSDALMPVALGLLGAGLVDLAGATALLVVGLRRRGRGQSPVGPAQMESVARGDAGGAGPVVVTARLDPQLSRWQWLVKWVLALPHFVVLGLLWPVFLVSTLMGGVAIVVTGAYPRALFEFNLGVLRWSWRVTFYATSGGIGTDRYPPFSLGPEPDYPATLDVHRPERLSRSLVLVKWLLALPHLLIVGLLLGSFRWLVPSGPGADRFDSVGGLGVLGLLVLVAGVVLLFTGRYPRALFDLIVGLNRWVYRVVVYVALMSDGYPPFRLDQGETEPAPSVPPAPLAPADPPVPVAGEGPSAPAGGVRPDQRSLEDVTR